MTDGDRNPVSPAKKKSTPIAEIAGIVVAAVVAVIGIVAILYIRRRRRRLRRRQYDDTEIRRQQHAHTPSDLLALYVQPYFDFGGSPGHEPTSTGEAGSALGSAHHSSPGSNSFPGSANRD